jgi:hypothetical protein
VARRFETVSISLNVGGADAAAHTITVGDRLGPPTAQDRDAAVRLARDLEREARASAAARRLSTSGQLHEYLRWRFSCRAGELLICDPWMLGDETEAVLRYLASFGRSVRALTGGIPEASREHFRAAQNIEVRAIPGGRRSLHDRVWIVGETGLLVGMSRTGLVGRVTAATTATELPHADAATWRDQFEAWWSVAR